MKKKEYLIMAPDRSDLFWSPDSRGYTTDIFDAGLYTKDEAIKIENLKRNDKKIHFMEFADQIYKTYKSSRRLLNRVKSYKDMGEER